MSQLVLERPGRHLTVRSADADGIRIGDTRYRDALVLGPQELLADWPPSCVEDLAPIHFDAVLAMDPEVVLLGTGETQQFLPPALLAPFYRAGVGVEVMSTQAACRTFNVLAMEERRVVAALLPL